MTPFGDVLRAGFPDLIVQADVPLAPLDDLQGRWPGRLAGRTARRRHDRAAAEGGARARHAGDDAGRRLERARRRCRRARPGDPAARRHDADGRPRHRARGRGRDHQRPRALDGGARPRWRRGVGRHARHRGRCTLWQRALAPGEHRRRRGERAGGRPRRRACVRCPTTAWSSATTRAACSAAAKSRSGRLCGCGPAVTPTRCVPWLAPRWPFASRPSRWPHRAPAASSRIRSRDATACPTACRCRRERSSTAPG